MTSKLIIICEDEKAQTWDILDPTLMKDGLKYTQCIEDHCDYEEYDDLDIASLTEKIMNDWNNVKEQIIKSIKMNKYNHIYQMNGFSMIIKGR